MEIELKPCPFCGGKATICEDGFVEYNVVCGHCFASIDYYPTRAKAIAAWNNRVGVAESATTTGERETVDISSRCIYGEAHVGVSKTDTTTGNAARMREAIVHMIDTADSIAMREPAGVIGKLAFHIKHTGDAALSAPPRNCEVGTAEEQSQRFDAFCDAHKYVGADGANRCSRNCPCYNNINCGVQWAQMPYPEGGAK